MNDRIDLLLRSNSCLKHTFTPKSCQASIICRSSSQDWTHRHTTTQPRLRSSPPHRKD